MIDERRLDLELERRLLGLRLERRLRDLAALQLELANEVLAIAERQARCCDELEQLADRLYADEQDLLAALFRKGEE